jgi:hypothetical protein
MHRVAGATFSMMVLLSVRIVKPVIDPVVTVPTVVTGPTVMAAPTVETAPTVVTVATAVTVGSPDRDGSPYRGYGCRAGGGELPRRWLVLT